MDTLNLSRALQAWHHSYSAIHGPLTNDQADVFRTLGEFLLVAVQHEYKEGTPASLKTLLKNSPST